MKKFTEKSIMAGGGLLVGFAGGFFGGGGGMLAVPLLNKILRVEAKKSHATAMLVILPMSVASAITYWVKGIFILKTTLITGAGVILGGIAGALLLKKLNSFTVLLIFSLLMIGIGVKLVFFK